MAELCLPDQHPAIDEATLRWVVRKHLGSDAAELGEWRLERLEYQVVWWGSTVYRVCGTAVDGAAQRSWSVILKALRRPVGELTGGLWNTGDDPRGYSYWRREADLYRDGLLDHAWDGFAPPRCYTVEEPDADNVRIWLEDVEDTFGPQWPFERHALAARHVGQFNGCYLVGAFVPEHPSFGTGYRLGPDSARWQLENLASDRWQQPAVRGIFPPAAVERMRRVWLEHATLVRAIENTPVVFAHRDAFRNNLIARGDQTVAVDWALAGPGHLGEDLYKMVINDLGFLRARAPAKVFEAALFEGYLAGLRDVGWQGDQRVARLGYAATALFHVPYGHLLRQLASPEGEADAVRMYRHSPEEMVVAKTDLAYMLIGLAEEALALAEQIS